MNRLKYVFKLFKKWEKEWERVVNKYFKPYIHIYVITSWLILLIFGYVTWQRISYFFFVLCIITLYKASDVLISRLLKTYIKRDKNFKLERYLRWLHYGILLHRYKNPFFPLLFKIGECLYHFIYFLTKKQIKPLYINLIYTLLYKVSGFTGLHIFLNKIYYMLINWWLLTFYEIFFKRLSGMVLSILIFTDVITSIKDLLQSMQIPITLCIYLFFLCLTFLHSIKFFRFTFNLTKDLRDIENKRLDLTLTGLICKNLYQLLEAKAMGGTALDKKAFLDFFNQNKLFFIWERESALVARLSYEAFLQVQEGIYEGTLYRNQWLEYANKPSYLLFSWISRFDTCDMESYILLREFYTNKKKKEDCAQVEALISYETLIFKVWLFYIWDYEKALGIKQSFFIISKLNQEDDFFFTDDFFFLYDTDCAQIQDYYEIERIEVHPFWNIYENKDFYKQLYQYVGWNRTWKVENEFDHLRAQWYKTYEKYSWEAVDNFSGEEKEVLLKRELLKYKAEWEEASHLPYKEKYQKLVREIGEFEARSVLGTFTYSKRSKGPGFDPK